MMDEMRNMHEQMTALKAENARLREENERMKSAWQYLLTADNMKTITGLARDAAEARKEVERLKANCDYLLQKSKFDTERLTQALKLNSQLETEIAEFRWAFNAIVNETEAAWCQWHNLHPGAEWQIDRMPQFVATHMLAYQKPQL